MIENAADRHAFITWAAASAHRLAGVEPDLDAPDLAPLAGIVGDARLVGLGETWHPVHEFLSINFRVARFLIEHVGFTAVFLEASLATSRRLDEFVQGRGPDLDELAFSAVWENAETRSFLRWLRARNHTLPADRRVRVLGIDMYILILDDVHTPGAAAESVISYLRRVDPDYAFPHVDAVRRVFDGFAVTTDRRTANFGYFATVAPEDRAKLLAAFTDAERRLAEQRAAYTERSDAEEFAWALHRATVVRRAARVYEANLESTAAGLVERVHGMTANIRWLLDHLGADTRAVLLGSSVHVARAPWAYVGSDLQLPSCGEQLAAWYGPEYVALATTFGRGAFEPPNPITGTTTIPDGAPDSVDLALAEVDANLLLVDLRGRTAPAPPAEWLARPRPLRPMQNVANPPTYLLADAFDGLLHVREIHGHREIG